MPRIVLSPDDITFEVRFALGQAPASLIADLHRKNYGKRMDALNRLAVIVAERFVRMEVSREVREQATPGPIRWQD